MHSLGIMTIATFYVTLEVGGQEFVTQCVCSCVGYFVSFTLLSLCLIDLNE